MALIRSDKPGFVHLWHLYGDEPLAAPLLEDQDGKGYHRTIRYQAQDVDGGVLRYQIVPDEGEVLDGRKVELLNHRHLSYEEFTKGMDEVADPSGGILRGVPIDLVPLQDEALLLAVTDEPCLQRSSPWILKIWRPTYHGRTQLPEELVSAAVQIGYMIRTQGAASNNVSPPDGQKLGRVSQRSGKLIAHLKYEYGSHSGFDGEVVLERPFDFEVRAFSGVVYPVVGVLTTQRDSMPFLLQQLRKDLKGGQWEAYLDETIGESGR